MKLFQILPTLRPIRPKMSQTILLWYHGHRPSPHQFKISQSVAISKPIQLHNDPATYRSIAVLNICYKLLERLLFNRLNDSIDILWYRLAGRTYTQAEKSHPSTTWLLFKNSYLKVNEDESTSKSYPIHNRDQCSSSSLLQLIQKWHASN